MIPVVFVKSTELQNIGLAKPRFRNTRKRGQNGTNWEMPAFKIHPHLALLKIWPFLRIDSRELPRFGLRIAGPSQSMDQGTPQKCIKKIKVPPVDVQVFVDLSASVIPPVCLHRFMMIFPRISWSCATNNWRIKVQGGC